MIEVELVGPLALLADGEKHLTVNGVLILSQVLRQLAEIYPRLGKKLINENGLSRQVIVYVDGKDIRFLSGEDTPLSNDSRIKILVSLAGG